MKGVDGRCWMRGVGERCGLGVRMRGVDERCG